MGEFCYALAKLVKISARELLRPELTNVILQHEAIHPLHSTRSERNRGVEEGQSTNLLRIVSEAIAERSREHNRKYVHNDPTYICHRQGRVWGDANVMVLRTNKRRLVLPVQFGW